MENSKRPIETVDPDYVFPENKKMKIAGPENDNNRKVAIIKKEFQTEMEYKEKELEEIEDRLKIAMKTLHLLRSVAISSYYNQDNLILNTQNKDVSSQINDPNVNLVIDAQSKIHPAVKKCLGKAPIKFAAPLRPRPRVEPGTSIDLKRELEIIHGKPKKEQFEGIAIPADGAKMDEDLNSNDTASSDSASSSLRNERFRQKYRIVIGNISKWIGMEDSSQDKSTHKWMVYVRGPKEDPNVSHIVKKVRFFLHPSYRPNDIIDVEEHPFHLSRRGWGEFPLRVQIHFVNNINKPIDVIHNIKLDQTRSGVQTLGSETFVNVWLYKEPINNLKKFKHMKLNIYESKKNSAEDENELQMLETECTLETSTENNSYVQEENFSTSANIANHNISTVTIEKSSNANNSSVSQNLTPSSRKSKNEKIIEKNEEIAKPAITKSSTELKRVVSLLNKNIDNSNINISLQMHDYCEQSTNSTDIVHTSFKRFNAILSFDHFIFNISKYKLNNISTILLYLLKHLPLVTPLAKNDLYLSTFPFVAQSQDEFLSWTKPKQFCSEWYRAKFIKSVLLDFNIPGIENWSVRSIIKFARLTKFGIDEQNDEMKNFEKILSAPMQFNSHTQLPELENFLHNCSFNKNKDHEDDDEEVDVINLDQVEKKAVKKKENIVSYKNIIDFTSKDVTNLPDLQIKETVAELGISLVPEEIFENVWCSSAEMCITAATKYFAEDLIRRAILNSNRFTVSSEINLEDVKAALLSREEFDVFFNFGLGKTS